VSCTSSSNRSTTARHRHPAHDRTWHFARCRNDGRHTSRRHIGPGAAEATGHAYWRHCRKDYVVCVPQEAHRVARQEGRHHARWSGGTEFPRRPLQRRHRWQHLYVIVAPALLTYLTYKIYTFPEKIADEVSKSVRMDEATATWGGSGQDEAERPLPRVSPWLDSHLG